jgi:pimeloyl-ACP methyl ester carboxylesterase
MAPLRPEWLIVDGLPMFHRRADAIGATGGDIVHVHGFGISGTYLEPTAVRLVSRFRNFIPDLPGAGRSMRREHALDIPGLATALIHYCDVVGIERATFVGNSLGCPVICEVAAQFPDRIERAVLVSPAGGPNNQPLPRALRQMLTDGPREPIQMLPIAVRDYLHFGVLQSLRLFGAMTRFPTVERVQALSVPTLVVVGERDPLVDLGRVGVLSPLPHVDAVVVPGAHALNFSQPQYIAELVEAFIDDDLARVLRARPDVRRLAIPE